MALVGYEAFAVIAVLLIVFIWGPNKVPELARAVGQAKREYDKVTKEATSAFQQAMTMPTTNPTAPGSAPPGLPVPALPVPAAPVPAAPVPPAPAVAPPAAEASTDPVIVAAKAIGINTAGKTKLELQQEIQARIK